MCETNTILRRRRMHVSDQHHSNQHAVRLGFLSIHHWRDSLNLFQSRPWVSHGKPSRIGLAV
jgi:hypothetical protein